MELISFMMTIYNNEQYIDEAIQSVLKIDYPQIEVVLVDDGSTDESCSIAERYAISDQRIRLFRHEKNLGVAKATKTGVTHCRGKYIFFAAADDITMPERVRETLSIFQRDPNVGMVVSNALIINSDSQETGEMYCIDNRIHSHNISLAQLKRNYCLGATITLLNDQSIFSKDSILQTADDYQLSLEFILARYRIEVVKQPLVKYRIHERNISNEHATLRKNVVKALLDYESKDFLTVLESQGHETAEIMNALGIFEMFRGKNEDGVKWLSEARRVWDNARIRPSSDHFFYFGVAEYLKGQYEKSQEYFTEAFAIDPSEPTVMNNLAVLKLKTRNGKKEAQQLLLRATAAQPDYLDARYNLVAIDKNIEYKLTTRLLDTTRFTRVSYKIES